MAVNLFEYSRSKKEEEEKKKEQEALEKSYSLLDSSGHLTDLFWPTRKRNFDNRFVRPCPPSTLFLTLSLLYQKNRGKRPLPDSTLDSEPAPDDLPVKKIKSDGYPSALIPPFHLPQCLKVSSLLQQTTKERSRHSMVAASRIQGQV